MQAWSLRPVRVRAASARLAALLIACASLGCSALRPSNDRLWSRDQTVAPTAELADDRVTVHHVRNCFYRSTEDYDLRYEDRSFSLSQVRSVDFIVVPFSNMPSGAHTMLSFGIAPKPAAPENYVTAPDETAAAIVAATEQVRDYLCLSVEIRRELGESFSSIKGSLRQYELMYVLGDERDLIGLRTNHRHDDVYVYRTVATPEQAQALLVDVLKRANKLSEQPEFYDTLANNCTTNIWKHVNDIAPPNKYIPYDYRILLPGYSDRLAYDRGLIETAGDFYATRARARVNLMAYIYRDRPDFSVAIRQHDDNPPLVARDL